MILTPAAKHYMDHKSIYRNNQEVYFERQWRRAGKNATSEAAKQICLKGVSTAHQPRDAAEQPQQGQKIAVRMNTALEKNWEKLLHIFWSLLESGDTPNLFTFFCNSRTQTNKETEIRDWKCNFLRQWTVCPAELGQRILAVFRGARLKTMREFPTRGLYKA